MAEERRKPRTYPEHENVGMASDPLDVIIFGDDDINTPFTAARKFAELFADGLKSSGLKVGVCAPAPTRRSSYLSRSMASLLTVAKTKQRATHLAYYGQRFDTLLALRMRCWFTKEILVVVLVEWPIAVPGRSLVSLANAKGFCGAVFRLSDGVIVISNQLQEIAGRHAPGLPIHRIRLLTKDKGLPRLTSSTDLFGRPRIVYCADLEGYSQDTETVVRASALAVSPHDLILIGRASEGFKSKLRDIAKEGAGKSELIFLSNVSDQALRNEYSGASALLLPLDDSLRSRCRFPSKLADYLLAGPPIITRCSGEIASLAGEVEGLLFADRHHEVDYAYLIDQVLSPEFVNRGASQRREFALKAFDPQKVGASVADFFSKIPSRDARETRES